MIGLITHIQRSVVVEADAIAVPERVQGVTSGARDSSDGSAIGSASWPHLHSVVGCIENVDGCAGDNEISRLIELTRVRSRAGADNGHGSGRTGLNDNDSIVALVGDEERRVVNDPYATIVIQAGWCGSAGWR